MKSAVYINIVFLMAYMIAVFIFGPIAGVAGTIAGLIYIFMQERELDEVKKGLAEIKSSNFKYEIPVRRFGFYLPMAQYINDIGNEFLELSLKNMCNDKMKTELITNISHDLRTPLTSIIN